MYPANGFMAEKGNPAGFELVDRILKMKMGDKPMSKYRLARALKVSDPCVDKWVKRQSAPLQENFNKLQSYLTYLERLNRIPNPLEN